jgi:anti-anti-sigma regulatory factor
MTFIIDQVQSKVPVTVLTIQGDLDGSNFQELIDLAKKAHQEGASDFLLDMSELNFMSSAGLVALLSISKLMRGETPPDPEYGWDALHEIDRDRDSGVQQHVKLLNPPPKVEKILEMSGMKKFFEIFTDKQTAIASFG